MANYAKGKARAVQRKTRSTAARGMKKTTRGKGKRATLRRR